MVRRILWIFVSLLFISTAFAELNLYLPFNNSIEDYSGKGVTITNITIPNYTTDQNGNSNSALYLNGSEYLNTTYNGTEYDNISVSVWHKYVGSRGGALVDNSPGTVGYYLYFPGSKETLFYVYNESGTGGNARTKYTFPINSWQHIVGVYNGTHRMIYINNSLYNYTKVATSSGIANSDTYMTIGRVFEGTELNGTIDELRIYNNSLTTSEISQLYYDGLISTNLSNYDQESASFDIGFTKSNIDTNLNCTVGINDTDLTLSPVCTVSQCTVSVIVGSSINKTFLMSPYCNDSMTTLWNGNNQTVHIDNINPTIEYNLTNLSYYFKNNISAQFNFSDQFSLYRWNITIDGENIVGAINPAYNSIVYNFTYNTSQLKPGTHYLVAEVADGHTSNLIPDYKVKYPLLSRNELRFDFPDKNYVRIVPKEKGLFDAFRVYKETDRYRFTFDNSQKGKNSQTFTISSDGRIEIITRPNTKYKKWLIVGNHWIDFYTPSEPGAIVEYNQIDINLVEVTISNLKNADSIEFHSVGDLNIVNYNFTFYNINSTISYSSPILERRQNTHTLTINTTGTPFTYNQINATLHYNGTTYTPTKSNDANYIYFTKTVTAPSISTESEQLKFSWNVSVDNIGDTIFNETQNIIAVQINNCSNASWAKALTIHGRQEIGGSNVSDMKLNINFDIHLGSYVYGSTDIKDYSFEFDGLTNYSICIYPNTTSYTVDAIMEYGDGNYTDRKYYLNNYILNNVTQNIYLYHLNDSVASDIIITVIDSKDGTRLPESFIKVLRYYPEQNVYKTVEIEKTDANGETLTKMVLADVFYKFIIEKPPGTVLLNSDVEKIKTTTKTLLVNTATNVLADIYEVLGINYDVSCTRSTRTCRFTWNNPKNTAVTGRLTVYEDTGYRQVVNYTEELTTVAGSIVHTFSNITNKRFIVEGAIING